MEGGETSSVLLVGNEYEFHWRGGDLGFVSAVVHSSKAPWEKKITVPPALFSYLYQEGAEMGPKLGLGAQRYSFRCPGNIMVQHIED